MKRPMLAYTIEDTSKESYPATLSVKLDGVRAVVVDGVVYSRSMKPIRSKAVQELFGKVEFNGLDGELLYGEWNAPNVFNLTTQVVMATELKPEFDKQKIAFAVFDYFLSDELYEVREEMAYNIINESRHPQVYSLSSVDVENEEELLQFEATALEDGFEGIMKRRNTKYKQGRSTFKEQGIGKLKRWDREEGLIVGFEEKMINTNAAKINEVGRSQRSQAQEGVVPAGTLGAFILESQGIRFTCGSGLDDAMRKEVWYNRQSYLGKYVAFNHFTIGRVDSFRFPIFQGFRDVEDMS